MGFANPIGLWGLSALFIPIAIHLLSRKEGRVILIGSLRHLSDANTQQFKSLRLNEILLLILRCLIIILLVLLISGLQTHQSSKERWVLIENGLQDDPQAKALIDSLGKQGYELRSLSTGFPTLDKISANEKSINHWTLVEQLKNESLTEAVLISSSRAENFKGERIQLPNFIHWIAINSPATDYLLAATRLSKDSVLVQSGSVQNENTRYQFTKTLMTPGQTSFRMGSDSVSISSLDSLVVTVASDPAFSFDRKIILASLKAIQKSVPQKLIVKESAMENIPSADWLIWLSDQPISLNDTMNILYFKANALTDLIEQHNAHRWILTKHLSEEIALKENLTITLAQLLLHDKNKQAIANSKDQRVMPEPAMWSTESERANGKISMAGFSPLDNYLISFIILVLFIERMIAYKRNQ